MSQAPRKKLSLLSEEAQQEQVVAVAMIDVLLPCRRFNVEYKVATLGKVALTTEFLLRFLRAIEGVEEEAISLFFDFDDREMQYVLSEAETLGFIERREGRVWITDAGSALFRDGGTEPSIFEVERRREACGFDLISLAPESAKSLSKFAMRLPELLVDDLRHVVSGSTHVETAFRRFFGELVVERDKLLNNRSLYTVDAVEPGDRFSARVSIAISTSNLNPAQMHIDLSQWRPEEELEDRPGVQKAAASFVRDIEKQSDVADQDGHQLLLEVAASFLDDFKRKDGLAAERYFREALTRAGDVRVDRKTVPIVGSLLLPENVRRFFDVVEYGARTKRSSPGLVWLAPNAPYWSMNAALPDFVEEIRARLGDEAEEDRKAICLATSDDQGRLRLAFDHIELLRNRSSPRSIECLLVPGVACAFVVHAPLGTQRAFPVPIGVASFDVDVLGKATEILRGEATTLGADGEALLGFLG